MKRREPKIGDTAWIRLPQNAKIIRHNKKYGYTLRTDDGTEWCYFGKNEFIIVNLNSKKKGMIL